MAKRNTKRVKLQELFNWRRPLPIFDHNGEEVLTVYQRLVNDKEQEKARLGALKRSRELRMALRDKTTEEHAAMMESLENWSKEEMYNVITMGHLPKYHQRAEESVKVQLPKPPPDGASLEELEEYENSVTEYDNKRAEEILKAVNKTLQEEVDKLKALPEEDLLARTVTAVEDHICRGAVTELMAHYSTYLGTFAGPDYRNRYFSSFEEFEELAPQVKQQLTKGYMELQLTPDELKN